MVRDRRRRPLPLDCHIIVSPPVKLSAETVAPVKPTADHRIVPRSGDYSAADAIQAGSRSWLHISSMRWRTRTTAILSPSTSTSATSGRAL